MNRFRMRPGFSFLRGLWLPVLSFMAILCFLLFGLNTLSERANSEEKQYLTKAVSRNITQYYALNGRYPESLKVLEESYPLIYDQNKYHIFYEPIGANIVPDVTISEK